MMRPRILFISGRHEDARRLSQMLFPLPADLVYVEDVRHARAELLQCDYQAVLTEAALPDGNWLDVLSLAREQPADVKVIVTDPQADARLWSQVLNLGAFDLVTQPFYEPEVRRILSNACSRPRDERYATALAG